MVQIGQYFETFLKWMKLVGNHFCQKMVKIVQTCQKWFKPVKTPQIFPKYLKLITNGSKLSKLFKFVPN